MAEAAKARGNAAFSAGKFEEAAKHFTEAASLAPDNHVLYSNRSAAYASLSRYDEALQDAKKTVELKPDWAKGYSRLGAAYVGLGKFGDAIASYKQGLEIEPGNEALKSGLDDAQAASTRPKGGSGSPYGSSSPFGNMFQGPDVWAKLQTDPRTRLFLSQPDFVAMLNDVQRNPSNLNRYINDPRMMQVLGVLLGVNIQAPSKEEDWGKAFNEDEGERPSPKPTSTPREAPKPFQPEPQPMEISDEEKDKRARKAEALKEKEAGNAAYKKKDFDTAIAHYTRALELDDEDISYLTNRAAVYLEMGKVRVEAFLLYYCNVAACYKVRCFCDCADTIMACVSSASMLFLTSSLCWRCLGLTHLSPCHVVRRVYRRFRQSRRKRKRTSC